MEVYGQLKKASLELTAGAPAQHKAGFIYFDTVTNRPIIDDGTDVTQIVMTKHLEQTLKDEQVISVTDIDTYANLDAKPRKQGCIYYATDSTTLYHDNGVALTKVGGKGLNQWTASTIYVADEIVWHNESVYKAKTGFTSGATFNESNWIVFSGARMAILENRKSIGQEGGATSADSKGILSHNTVVGPNPELITLSGGTTGIDGTAAEFTFNEDGTYFIQGKTQIYKTGRSQMLLYDVDAAQYLNYPVGMAAYASDSVSATYHATIDGFLTVTAGQTYTMLIYTQIGNAAGKGIGGQGQNNTSPHELFNTMNITKVK